MISNCISDRKVNFPAPPEKKGNFDRVSKNIEGLKIFAQCYVRKPDDCVHNIRRERLVTELQSDVVNLQRKMEPDECPSCVHNQFCHFCKENITLLCDLCFQKKELQSVLPSHLHVSTDVVPSLGQFFSSRTGRRSPFPTFREHRFPGPQLP